jgi:hypothetical protein
VPQCQTRTVQLGRHAMQCDPSMHIVPSPSNQPPQTNFLNKHARLFWHMAKFNFFLNSKGLFD